MARPQGPRPPGPVFRGGLSRGCGGKKRVGIATTSIPPVLHTMPSARTIGAGRLRRLVGHDPHQSPGAWSARSTDLLSGCQEHRAVEEASRRAVHILPISIVSRQGKSQEDEAPNACIFNRGRQTMGGETCQIQVPNAAECHSSCSIAYKPCRTLLSRHPWSLRLCYDGVASTHGGQAPGREEARWTLSRSWTR